MLTLMKGDKVVEVIQILPNSPLFFQAGECQYSRTELVIIKVKADASFLKLFNQFLKIR